MMRELLTTGVIARKLGVARARLDYAIDKAGIRERGRAGILRLFSPNQIPVLEAALRTVRSRNAQQADKGGDGDHAHR